MKNTNVIKITKEIKILLLGISIFLSGCMGMNSKFDCNVSSDGRCASMGSIYKMADRGEFNESSNHRIIENNNSGSKYQKYPLSASADYSQPIRSSDTIQKIWIGPYEDENGNYHDPAYVYAVIKKASWLAESEQVIKD